jgi:hypothetical protein
MEEKFITIGCVVINYLLLSIEYEDNLFNALMSLITGVLVQLILNLVLHKSRRRKKDVINR